jgi:hypothetical protein
MKNCFSLLSPILIPSVSIFIFSCNTPSENNTSSTEKEVSTPLQKVVEPNNNATSQLPQITSDKIDVKAFEVKETQGWGYDIYVDSKRMIHQPNIPAIQGNRSFKTEKQALTAGLFAADKLKRTGTLPTITPKELDSIGVIQ